jgi:hypothetical protein
VQYIEHLPIMSNKIYSILAGVGGDLALAIALDCVVGLRGYGMCQMCGG